MYVIRFIDPFGVESYWPKGFGFDTHAHTTDLAKAERFADATAAWRSLSGYVSPPFFWESERRHAKLMKEKFRNWKYDVIEA